jgi:dTDP-4-dehydrorhamnose 3,5-epimerase
VLYKVDTPYNPRGEGGIRWNDPDLAISWPVREPIVSARDQSLERFADYAVRVGRYSTSPER